MSELIAIVLAALLFGVFGVVRRGRERSADCRNCPEGDRSAPCDRCPLSTKPRRPGKRLRLER